MLIIELYKYYTRARRLYSCQLDAHPHRTESWAALGLCLVCIVCSFPSYDLFLHPNVIVATNWQALQAQAEHPLTPRDYPAELHHGQIAFRLLLPVLAHLGQFSILWFLALLPVAGWLFFRTLLALCRRVGFDGWASFWLALGFAFTYVGKGFFVDVIGYFDGYCYLLLLLSLMAPQRYVAMLAWLGALFVDERAFLAVPLCVVARLWIYMRFWRNESPKLKNIWFEAWPALVTLSLAVVIRIYLTHQFGLQNGATSENLGLITFRGNFQVAAIGLLSGLDFYLFVGFLPAIYWWFTKQRLLGVLYTLYMCICLAAMMLVLDLTRCTAYLFPAALAGLFAIARHESLSTCTRVPPLLAVTAFAFPPLFTVGTTVLWMGPIFPKVLRMAAKAIWGVDI